MHFGEYELSPGLIGLSLLRTSHPKAFQRLAVRTSSWCYPAFILLMRRSPGFASAAAHSTPYSDSLSLRLRTLRHLASPATTTRRLIMQKARRHSTKELRPLAGAWFQGLFHSPSGVLFTFPSRYSFAIGLSVVFSLAGWSPPIQPEFLVFRPTQVACPIRHRLRVRDSHPLRCAVPCASPSSRLMFVQAPTTPPAPRRPRFGLFPVRSPLLGESFLLSLPAGTGMFRFPAFASGPTGCRDRSRRVAPFGYPRIKGYLLLHAAFRSLSRPSSPPRAKASSMRPSFSAVFLRTMSSRLTGRHGAICFFRHQPRSMPGKSFARLGFTKL